MLRIFLLMLLSAACCAQDVLIWHPGAGGNAEQAEPVLGDFARYLESAMGAEAGTVSLRYAATEEDGPAAGTAVDIAIVSLPVFLKHGEAFGWSAVLHAERAARPTGRYVTVMADENGTLPPLDEVASGTVPEGLKVYGTELWDARFAEVFVVPGGAEYNDTRTPHAAMRRAEKMGALAVLNELEYADFQANPKYQTGFSVAHVSEELPVNLVVVREGVDAAALLAALQAMPADPAADELRETLRLRAFLPADEKTIADLCERY